MCLSIIKKMSCWLIILVAAFPAFWTIALIFSLPLYEAPPDSEHIINRSANNDRQKPGANLDDLPEPYHVVSQSARQIPGAKLGDIPDPKPDSTEQHKEYNRHTQPNFNPVTFLLELILAVVVKLSILFLIVILFSRLITGRKSSREIDASSIADGIDGGDGGCGGCGGCGGGDG
jgi:hypothetical protein